MRDALGEALDGLTPKRIGIVGWTIMPISVYVALREATESVLVNADNLLGDLRIIKSENEISLLKQASAIAEKAIDQVLEQIRPGMTELQVVGLAQAAIYDLGAEYEGMPQYVFGGRNTRHAAGRPTHRVLELGDIVQLNIGARVEGYSSSIGRPISLGPMPAEVKRLVQFGKDAHLRTIEWMHAGTPARDIVRKYYDFVRTAGYGDYLFYGPCHGLGMIEVEKPWVETTSDYDLCPNMTFQIDTFLRGLEYGIRWEDGLRVTQRGPELFSGESLTIVEIK
jgi:Xaa-Pro aminopeptidase